MGDEHHAYAITSLIDKLDDAIRAAKKDGLTVEIILANFLLIGDARDGSAFEGKNTVNIMRRLV